MNTQYKGFGKSNIDTFHLNENIQQSESLRGTAN